MAASVASRQVLSRIFPGPFQFDACFCDLCSVKSNKSNGCKRRKRISVHVQGKSSSRVMCQTSRRTNTLQIIDGAFHRKTYSNRLESIICNCQSVEANGSIKIDNQDSKLSKNLGKPSTSSPYNGTIADDGISQVEIKHENGGYISNNKSPMDGLAKEAPHKVSENLIEEEAWDLLRDSIVYYCNNPVGTIAANDPNSSSILNYDQVFIRDFIPSGIAFLLKGEYDIVRNFILHTLQLQVITC